MTEKLRFQLLDLTYEVEGGIPVIIIWGRTEDDRRVLLRYDKFRPYFYAIPEETYSPEEVRRQILQLSKPSSPIIKAEVVDRRYIGRPVKAVKATTMVPAYVREYREAVARLDSVRLVLEADIRFTMRYLIDYNLYPMRWYEAEVRKRTGVGPYRVDAVYDIVSDNLEEVEEYADKDPLEGLKIMAFDIEVYSKEGSPDPRKDPIIIIGYATNQDPEPKILAMEGKSDAPLIRAFVEAVQREDPDIIVGYNQNKFDWPYLQERSRFLNITLDVGRRRGGPPQTSVYGHISIPGRLNVDLYDFAKEIHEIKVKTLEEVADYLDVVKKDERVILEWWEIPEYWDDPKKRPTLIQYAKDDVRSTLGLVDKFLPFGAQLSQVSGLPMDQVMAASVGFRLEWRLIREAFKRKELAPNRVERREETYTGAIVLKPKKGVHENIAVLDFASMYPNIMVKYNVGPDTLVKPGEKVSDDEVYVAPVVGHRYKKKPDGFFKQALKKFLDIRRRIKEEMKKYPKDSAMYRLLHERQRAVKVLANATYGYMGWTGARWYCRECAESVTAWGRQIITSAIEKARSMGLEVIYGDTDSLFVKYIPDKVNALIEFVEKNLGFEIKIDKIYRKVFFTEAKKRYVGLTEDGKVDVVGFEAVRGDWSELAKETQLKVAEIVLRTGDVNKAVDYVRNVIERLRRGDIEYRKLIIWKTLSKKLEEYAAEQPHVYAARLMASRGIAIQPGMKIGYVIVKGGGPLSRKARPYFMASVSDIDVNYYVEKQVIPAAMRILSYFGVRESSLRTGKRQRTLFDFMGG